jgi:hypothetical protein
MISMYDIAIVDYYSKSGDIKDERPYNFIPSSETASG